MRGISRTASKSAVVGAVLASLTAGVGVARANDVTGLPGGGLDAEALVRGWKEAGLSAADAAAAVRELPRVDDAPLEDHQARIRDPHGRETDVRVGMPEAPGPDGRYRVLVMLHGLGGNSKQGFEEVRAFAPPGTIVVATTAKLPAGGAEAEDMAVFGGASVPILGRLRKWWSYREDAFPLLALDYLKERYPLDLDRTLLVGISMGGFGAWNLGLRYHDRFAGVVPLAGGISRSEYLFRRDDRTRRLLGNATMVPVFFVHGGADWVVPPIFDQWTSQDLTDLGIAHDYVELQGAGHVVNPFQADPDLRDRLVDWMRTRVRDPHPRRVEHHAIGAYHGQAFWVRIDAFEGEGARVVAEVPEPNRIELTSEGASRVTLFVDPALHDVTRPITVTLDGREVYQGQPAPSLEAVAESFAHARDPALVYERAIHLDLEAAAPPADEEAQPAEKLRYF